MTGKRASDWRRFAALVLSLSLGFSLAALSGGAAAQSAYETVEKKITAGQLIVALRKAGLTPHFQGARNLISMKCGRGRAGCVLTYRRRVPSDAKLVIARAARPSYAGKCPYQAPLIAAIETTQAMSGEIWVQFVGGGRSRVHNWSVSKAGRATSTLRVRIDGAPGRTVRARGSINIEYRVGGKRYLKTKRFEDFTVRCS